MALWPELSLHQHNHCLLLFLLFLVASFSCIFVRHFALLPFVLAKQLLVMAYGYYLPFLVSRSPFFGLIHLYFLKILAFTIRVLPVFTVCINLIFGSAKKKKTNKTTLTAEKSIS